MLGRRTRPHSSVTQISYRVWCPWQRGVPDTPQGSNPQGMIRSIALRPPAAVVARTCSTVDAMLYADRDINRA